MGTEEEVPDASSAPEKAHAMVSETLLWQPQTGCLLWRIIHFPLLGLMLLGSRGNGPGELNLICLARDLLPSGADEGSWEPVLGQHSHRT